MTHPTSAAPPFSRRFAVDEAFDAPHRAAIEADPQERAALAAAYGLEALHVLKANVTLTALGAGRFGAKGRLNAKVTQICVVSLDPFDSEIVETFETEFAPQDAPSQHGRRDATVDASADADDEADPIVDGRVDLGVLAAEFLALALDTYPRKPGVAFEHEPVPPEPSPFAALAQLKRDKGDA